jgi:hypothetical protein
MTALPKEVPTIPVVMTVVGGRVAYSRERGAEPTP